jgi:hypothetical protein
LKKFIAISFLILFFTPDITRIWLVIDFKINQNFIEKSFCINKDEPIPVCQGSCYLAKQLKKTDESEQRQVPLSLVQKSETILFIHDVLQLKNYNTLVAIVQEPISTGAKNMYISNFFNNIFIPPQLFS